MENYPLTLTEKVSGWTSMLSDYKVAIPVYMLVFWMMARWVYPSFYYNEEQSTEQNISKASWWIALINGLAVAVILYALKSQPGCGGQVISGGIAPF